MSAEPTRPARQGRQGRLARHLPILDWGRRYRLDTFGRDLTAAAIVSVMLVPQSLAYALLAGLPPEVGLYASILPLIAYALLGTGCTLAVGPVAIVSLMTAAAAGSVATVGTPEYLGAALLLAVLSGAMLALAGVFRLGFLANFLSHPVVSGFVTASGIVIALSQLRHLLGIEARGHTLPVLLRTLGAGLGDVHGPTAVVGGAAVAFLFAARRWMAPGLSRLGAPAGLAALLARASPALAVLGGIAAVRWLALDERGVSIVGVIPRGLPAFSLPPGDTALALSLAGAAALIALIGFVESVSVARTFAARRRQRIDPDQELLGLGAANLVAGFSGGMPLSFVHNGTLPRFAELRPLVLRETSATQRAAIGGQTDSEHLFRHLLTLRERSPTSTLAETLRRVVGNVERWMATLDDKPRVGLNLVLSDGREVAGTRWGRTLHRVERHGVYDCEICGFPHIHHDPDREHRAVVVASEPLTREVWTEIPERSLWTIDADARFGMEPLRSAQNA